MQTQNLNYQIFKFQQDHQLPVSPSISDTGIFTYNKDIPVPAEILQVNTQNGYPLLEIRALIPFLQETRRETPMGWETIQVCMLRPQIFSKVQICYPEVEFAMVPKPLPNAQQGDGFAQSLTDDWLPSTLNTQARLPHGLRTSNTNKFYSESIYKFQLYLHRYEYPQEIAPNVTRNIPEVILTLPSPTTFYPSFQQCFDDFYHAKFANPRTTFIDPQKFQSQEQRWDVVEIRPVYKEVVKESPLLQRATYILAGTNQETTLPVDINEVKPTDVILRKGEWWKNERLGDVMLYVKSKGIEMGDI